MDSWEQIVQNGDGDDAQSYLNNNILRQHLMTKKSCPIYEACSYNNIAVLNVLLANNIQLKLSPKFYINFALKYCDAEITNRILDLCHSCEYTCAVIKLAIDRTIMDLNSFDILEKIVSTADKHVFTGPEISSSALEHATSKIPDDINYTKILELLIDHGANITQKNLLECAISNQNITALNFLIANGVDVNPPKYKPSLYLAMYHSNIEAIKILTANGATINDKQQSKLLIKVYRHIQRWGARHDVFDTVFSANILDINARDKQQGNTLLNIAMDDYYYDDDETMGDQYKFIAMLLGHGADINMYLNNQGVTAFMLAAHGGCINMVKLMLNYNPNFSLKSPAGYTIVQSLKAALISIERNGLNNGKIGRSILEILALIESRLKYNTIKSSYKKI